MFKSLVNCIIAAFVGLLIAALLVPNFSIVGSFNEGVRTLLLAGVVLGLINFFIKPIINVITWPLKFLTFGLFSLAVNLAIIWFIDILFTPEITVKGFVALFLTSVLVWLFNMLTSYRED